jgi:hypothetical protein
MNNQILKGDKTPAPMACLPRSCSIATLFMQAGQIASDYKTGVPPEAKQDSAFPYYRVQTSKSRRDIFSRTFRSVFANAGSDFRDVVKAQVFLKDLNDFYLF